VLVEEAARSLAAYGSKLEADPAALDAMEDRREALRRLVRKHGTDLDGVIALRESLAAELDNLTRYEESLLDARGKVERLGEIAAREAAALTSARRRAGVRLAKAVTKELADLSFDKAVFEVVLAPREGGPSTTGADRAEFRVALNPGEGGHALRKVASGGELSRMMLALRRVLAGVGPVGTYVFDEVDAGIGGAVATAVGSKLSEVGDHHQVICITHLPQICAMASTHFHVSKRERDGRTVTTVERLDGDRRIEEVARMLGGARVTPKIRAAAAELFVRAPRGR
jgi:DNA repair protein RecN (Recombination protein N)